MFKKLYKRVLSDFALNVCPVTEGDGFLLFFREHGEKFLFLTPEQGIPVCWHCANLYPKYALSIAHFPEAGTVEIFHVPRSDFPVLEHSHEEEDSADWWKK